MRLTTNEKEAWEGFREITSTFLETNEDPDYKNIVENHL